MSALYNFSLDKTRALLLAGCFAAAAILLFFAGSLSGILYSGHLSSQAATTRVVQAPALPKPMQAHATSQPTPSAPAAPVAPSPAVAAAATSAPAASGAAALSNSAAPAIPAPSTLAPATGPPASAATSAPSGAAATTPPSAVAGAKSQPAVPAAPRPVEASYAIPLAVRVGSFSVKANAETLMQSLKDLGYRPAMSLYSDPHGRTWYVVKLGPYTRWNKASQVAARVSIAENVKPVIGPMGPIQ